MGYDRPVSGHVGAASDLCKTCNTVVDFSSPGYLEAAQAVVQVHAGSCWVMLGLCPAMLPTCSKRVTVVDFSSPGRLEAGMACDRPVSRHVGACWGCARPCFRRFSAPDI